MRTTDLKRWNGCDIVRNGGRKTIYVFVLPATLSLDGIEHDAHIQTIDKAEAMADLDGGPEIDYAAPHDRAAKVSVAG